jgi:lipoprotein-anchoring transpeptidase ErfK/SrfK
VEDLTIEEYIKGMKKLAPLFIGILLVFLFALPHQVFAAGPKRVDVDLSQQRLYAYEGDTRVFDFPISSGTTKTPTVTGYFHPYWKTPSIRMTGGNAQDGGFYDLPNVPYDVFFYQGYALHGTYWHHNFGHLMSHGCINLPTPDAKLIYNWIDLSTPIHIYGVTPAS